MSYTSAELVARAAEYLDALFEDDKCCRGELENWRTKIDTDSLRMLSIQNCILGQLFGNYDDGMAKLREWEYSFGIATKSFGPVKLNDISDAFAGEDEVWKDLLNSKPATDRKFLKSKISTTAYEVLTEVDLLDKTWYVVLPGFVRENKFAQSSTTTDPKIFPKDSFVDYEDWEPIEFKKGRFYKSQGGEFVGWMESDTRMVALIGSPYSEPGNTGWGSPEFYASKYGKLTQIMNNSGEDWSTETGIAGTRR